MGGIEGAEQRSKEHETSKEKSARSIPSARRSHLACGEIAGPSASAVVRAREAGAVGPDAAGRAHAHAIDALAAVRAALVLAPESAPALVAHARAVR
jgi:hypothetical protein